MDITLALQRAVRGFPHGTAALAARLKMSESTLNHKVSPTYPGSGCFPEEAAEICEATGDMGALHAIAARLRHVAMPVPDLGDETDTSVLRLAATVREFGEFVSQVAGALADNRVTGSELANIEREAAQTLAAINHLVQLARRVHEAAKPPQDAARGEGASHRKPRA